MLPPNTQNNSNQNPNSDFVMSYLLLRQSIGILGMSLPFILVLGTMFIGNCSHLLPSISHYYYGTMHIVFVGTLCVLGGFLITYRGKSNFENKVSNVAGFFAFCVSIFPTSTDELITIPSSQFIQLSPAPLDYVSWVHYGSATILFVCFIVFCWKIFQESDVNKQIDKKKKRRNKIYKSCGMGIAVSIGIIAAVAIYNKVCGTQYFPYATFIFETTSLLFFGFSWLLKGSLNWPHSKNKIKRNIIGYLR